MKRILVGLFSIMAMSTPAFADEQQPKQEFTLGAGLHLATSVTPIFGVNYRRELSDLFALDAAFEAGQMTSGSYGDVTMPLTKFHLGFITNTPVYIGAGATYMQISPISTSTGASLNANAGSIEAIFGLRLHLLRGLLGGEFRLGLTGPSTAMVTLGATI